MITENEYIEIVKKFYKYLDEGQLDTLKSYFAPDAKIFYESGDPVSFSDMEPFIIMFYTSFPDYKHHIDDIFATGEKVVARLSYSGTFSNSFMEMKPTGSKFKYKGIQIFQFFNDKISNFWVVEDELGMMRQLGMELSPKEAVQ